MSKSEEGAGTVNVLDDLKAIEKKRNVLKAA